MIRLTGIERTFVVGDEEVRALRGVSLTIEHGEYLSIMGPSGSGKSTLLNVIGLLDRPNAGIYELDGRDVTGLRDDQLARVRSEKMGFVFQFFHLVPRLTAEQNIELPMVLAGIDPAERRKRLDRLLAEYGLQDRGRHRPDQLSGGQCQRVAIARAMSMSPSVILADEPTGNLDRRTGQEVMAVLERLHHDGGTVVLVTHDPEIGSRAHRTLRMIDGEIVSDEKSKMGSE
ncbi:MAG: ABC transporter ATP-binding protein [Betaproteobacteria bacterium]|nr:ABC transporter ATP-binding protein [Betaproteobacteria bacterium]